MNLQLLEKKLSNFIDPQILLWDAKLFNRSSLIYGDPLFLPFYYYLGSQLSPKSVLQIGGDLGEVGICFLKGCKTVKQWFVGDKFNQTALSNLSKHCEEVSFVEVDSDLKVDLVLCRDNWEWGWKSLNEGYLVADYLSGKFAEFEEFASLKNRTPSKLETRYLVGILEK